MKVASGNRMCGILEGRGWVYDHTNGSHVYKHPASVFTIVVPVHGNHDLKRGTQKGIMRQDGLTDADL